MLLGENKKYVKIAVTGIVISAAAIAILFLFYRFEAVSAVIARVFSILRPFLYGGVIAYLLAPLCGKLEARFGRLFGEKRKRGAKALSILLCVLLASAVVVLLCLIIFPQVMRSVINIASALPGQLRSLSKTIEDALADQPDIQAQWDNISNQVSTEIEKWTKTDILPLAQSILAGTASYVSSFVIFLRDVLLGIVIAVYLLAQRRQIADQTKLLVHTIFSDHWSTLIESETHYIDRMFNSFITGKLLDSAIVGVLCFIG
jgi:predicted PurR-regulated permease PerM